jgi:hypothetical protein
MSDEQPSSFRLYMDGKPFDLKAVASVSHLPLSTLWRIAHDLPISPENAAKVKRGLWQLTGQAYPYLIVTYEMDEVTQPVSTVSAKKVGQRTKR